MADKVKELYRGTVTLQQIQESTDGTVELYTTDDKTQHVIKDIQFNGKSHAESYITNNGFVECKTGIPASGSSIVDKNSTIALKSTKNTFSENQITFSVGTDSGTTLITQKLISDSFTNWGFREISRSSKPLNGAIIPRLTNRHVLKGNNAFVSSSTQYAAVGSSISLHDISDTPDSIVMFAPDENTYAAFSPYKNTIYFKPKSSNASILALDVESAPYMYSVGSENINRIVLGDNGKYIYTLDNFYSNGRIKRRTLNTPWDLRKVTATTSTTFSTLGGTAISYSAFQFNSVGTKVYGLDTDTKIIREITLTTAWDLSSGTRTAVSNVTFNNAVDFYMHTDGTFIIVKSNSENTLKKYPLSTPFDITKIGAFTESYTHVSLNGTGQFAVSSDGNYIVYVSEYHSSYLYYHTIKIKLNNGNFSLASCTIQETVVHHSSGSVNSATSVNQIAFASKAGSNPIAFGANGTRMYWNFQSGSANNTLLAYKVNSTFSISNYTLNSQVISNVNLNDNTITPLPSADWHQRLYAEGKYLFYSQNNGNNIYVIDTDTWNVGLLTDVGLAASFGVVNNFNTTHSFSVHYNVNTDEYGLMTFASSDSGNAVCYVPSRVIELVCSNRNSYSCAKLEKYSNGFAYSSTTASVDTPPVLVDKYFLITPINNIATSNNIPAVYDIRTGKLLDMNDDYKTFNFLGESLVSGLNIKFISIDALPTLPDSVNYALYNKDIDIRISGIEIREEN